MGILDISTLDRTLLPALAGAMLSVAAFSAGTQAKANSLAISIETPASVVELFLLGLQCSMPLTCGQDADTIRPATAEQRRRGKSMSRRSGQAGTIVKEGGWYRVRFRIDVPGQHERKQMSVKICPAFGPELLTKSERERRKAEIVNSLGANSLEQFNKVKAIEMGHTFREQAKKWLQQRMTRKRKPDKQATVRRPSPTDTSRWG